MQKLRKKLNANAVGATSSRPHFEGMTLKREKGITLIALIITIIVMLILVGVTINVALNGGVFEKAETATKQTQIEAEKEELLSAVVAAIGTDAKVDFDYLDDNLPNKWNGEDGTYTSPKGNTYTVDEKGKIEGGSKTNKGGNDNIIQLLNKFISGEISDKELAKQVKHELSIENENIDSSDGLLEMIMDETETYCYMYVIELDEVYVANLTNSPVTFSYAEEEKNKEQYNFFRNIKIIREELENVFSGKTQAEMVQKYNDGTLDDYVLNNSEKITAIEFRESRDSYIAIKFVTTIYEDSNEITLSYYDHNYTINVEYEDGNYSYVDVIAGT